jgi:hypothetical protein
MMGAGQQIREDGAEGQASSSDSLKSRKMDGEVVPLDENDRLVRALGAG